jgi:hypothetical protein
MCVGKAHSARQHHRRQGALVMMQPSSAPQSARTIGVLSPPRWVVLACALSAVWVTAAAGTSGSHRLPLTAQRTDATQSADARSALQASNAMWRGETYAALTERWWRWYVSIPYGVGPNVDPSGANCGINQSGPVWFLSGKLGSTWSSACTVPVGTAILTPVFDVLDDYPCPYPFQPAPGTSLEAFLQADIANYVDPLAYATATLDNKPLQVRRVKTSLFAFTGAADNVQFDTCITGSPQVGVSDGYFVFIEPLPPGQHILQLRSGSSVFGGPTEGTITLTVK